MWEDIREYALVKILGALIGAIIGGIIAYQIFLNEEKRKDHKHNIEISSMVRDEEYDDLMSAPSIEGIVAFCQKYNEDPRVGRLIEMKRDLQRKERERKLLLYVEKEENPSLDSLYSLLDISQDSLVIKKVARLMKEKYSEEILLQPEYDKIKDYESKYPKDTERLSLMYSKLERLCYFNAIVYRSQWHCMEYFSLIPDSLRFKWKEVNLILSDIEKKPFDIDKLGRRSFMADSKTIRKLGAPMILRFGNIFDGSNIELTIIVDDKVYDKTRAYVRGNCLAIDIYDPPTFSNFSNLKYYFYNSQLYLESIHGSPNGLLSFYEEEN